MAFTHVQIETDALVKLFLVGVAGEDGLKQFGRLPILVPLKSFYALFVPSDRLDVGRSARRSVVDGGFLVRSVSAWAARDRRGLSGFRFRLRSLLRPKVREREKW
jgi:hypothetical protein